MIAEAPNHEKRDGRRERGLVRQRALLEAARDLFMTEGFRGTTLEAIIARAGGSRETIYRVFGGKRGLFSAIVSDVGLALANATVTPVALTLPPRVGLTRVAQQLADVWHSAEGRAINRVVLSEGLDASELVDAWYQGGVDLSIRAVARYLEEQVKQGRLRPLDPPLVARQFVVLLMGEMAFPFVSGHPDRPERALQISRCVQLILDAYHLGEATDARTAPQFQTGAIVN